MLCAINKKESPENEIKSKQKNITQITVNVTNEMSSGIKDKREKNITHSSIA